MCVQDFYEDIFEELAKFGEVQNLNVCDNLADHMVGSVYAKVRRRLALSGTMRACAGLQPLKPSQEGYRPVLQGLRIAEG